MNGFRQRVLTAIIFGIIVIAAIWVHPYTCVALLGVITVWTSFEYGATVNPSKKYLVVFIALAFFLTAIFIPDASFRMIILIGSLLTGATLSYFVFKSENKLNHETLGYGIAGFYLGGSLGLFSHEMLTIPDYKYYFLGILVLIWLSDTGAYIVGSQWGKRKLMPKVSPNKTVEGFLGSLIAALIGGLIMSKLTPINNTDWWIIISLVIWLIGSLGDLVQSSVKRKYGVKDTGTILPGHGGLWDRFDSLILVIPVVLFLDAYVI